jgi:hypothetical protein
MKNILIEIEKEHLEGYCVHPNTVQDAVNRKISKLEILEALIDVYQNRPEGFYVEDFNCCLFTANQYLGA